MAAKIQNGRAVTIGTKKLRRSASDSEQSINELRYRKSTKYLFDTNETPIDLQKISNFFGRSLKKKTRYRRTQSVTRAEEITTKEKKQRQKQPDKP